MHYKRLEGKLLTAKNTKTKWKIISEGKQLRAEKDIFLLLLKNRNITGKKNIDAYLNPPHPLKITLKDLNISVSQTTKAIKRIKEAVKDKESIIIFGDYDADGICATAILWETLYGLSELALPYIPHREQEGYGLSVSAVDKLVKEFKPKLIITVDNGVTANKAISYAKNKGVDVIICDHHIIPKEKPRPLALIHSTQVSGSSMAWFLAREIINAFPKNDLQAHNQRLELAAIGSVADILPLRDTSRSIVYHGLQALRKTVRYGLRALLDTAGIKKEELDTYHIGYMISPRLNAAGRITHALDSLRLLCTTSLLKAQLLAQKLSQTNKERQVLTEKSYSHSLLTVTKTQKENKIIVIADSSYNQGIIGLVAGKITQEFNRPAIVIALGEKYSKASARSVPGLDIITLLRTFNHLLIDCGGHPMAAGFTIETKNIDIFKNEISKITQEAITPEMLIKELKIDCEIDLSQLTKTLYSEIQKLKPFGPGNPEPVFAVNNIEISAAKLVGAQGKHLSLKARDKNSEFRGIFFNAVEKGTEIDKNSLYNIAFTLMLNNWNGERLELKIKDMQRNSLQKH